MQDAVCFHATFSMFTQDNLIMSVTRKNSSKAVHMDRITRIPLFTEQVTCRLIEEEMAYSNHNIMHCLPAQVNELNISCFCRFQCNHGVHMEKSLYCTFN